MVFALEVKVWGALSVVSGKLSNKEPSRLRMAVDERSNLLLLCVCDCVLSKKAQHRRCITSIVHDKTGITVLSTSILR